MELFMSSFIFVMGKLKTLSWKLVLLLSEFCGHCWEPLLGRGAAGTPRMADSPSQEVAWLDRSTGICLPLRLPPSAGQEMK